MFDDFLVSLDKISVMKKLLFVFTLLVCFLGCEEESNEVSGSIVGEWRLTKYETSVTDYVSYVDPVFGNTYNFEPVVVFSLDGEQYVEDSVIFTSDGKVISSNIGMIGNSENYTFEGAYLTLDGTTTWTNGLGNHACDMNSMYDFDVTLLDNIILTLSRSYTTMSHDIPFIVWGGVPLVLTTIVQGRLEILLLILLRKICTSL